jgi:hypothetical protein
MINLHTHGSLAKVRVVCLAWHTLSCKLLGPCVMEISWNHFWPTMATFYKRMLLVWLKDCGYNWYNTHRINNPLCNIDWPGDSHRDDPRLYLTNATHYVFSLSNSVENPLRFLITGGVLVVLEVKWVVNSTVACWLVTGWIQVWHYTRDEKVYLTNKLELKDLGSIVISFY